MKNRSEKDNGHGELIDTLWNVNATGCTVAGSFARELIDTLWNVNKDGCEYVAVDFTN